jgi:hypothetical protein
MTHWKTFRIFGLEIDFQARNTVDTLATLLPEVFGRIFAFLDFQSIGRISCACKTFNELNNAPSLWAERLAEVRKRYAALVAMGVLPSDYELDFLARLLEMPGNVGQDSIGKTPFGLSLCDYFLLVWFYFANLTSRSSILPNSVDFRYCDSNSLE